MKKAYHPAVVVAAFNRVDSLKRVLKSLSLAHYPEKVKLIISIDNNGTNQDVFELANSFQWDFGVKEVIYHKERLGLRRHILKCGDLSLKYGSIIMLEDDLYVSPYFYKYTLEALDFYGSHPKIAGISIYKISYAEANKLPFNPIEDHSDVFFMQLAASLGQCWTAAHWEGFKKWYDTSPDLKAINGLPEKIKNWSDGSWKKFYIGYLIVHDKYFVFPRLSYTTNFNDVGENMIMRSLYVQVPIQLFDRKPNFVTFEESKIIYDAYSEITAGSLNQLSDVLTEYDFEVDLYGKKDYYSKPYILTTRPVKKSIRSFERSMKPHEMNVIMKVEGSEIFLAKKEDVIVREPTIPEFSKEFAYFYTPIFRTSKLLEIIKYRLKDKYVSRFVRK
ncbi:MAG: glycosyltransferase [Bacteroidetes bacterium]|nr:glycosyltransferase [Bacteroidota bacterium]